MSTRGLRDVLGVADTNAQVPIRETCLHKFVEFSVLLYRYESRYDKAYVLGKIDLFTGLRFHFFVVHSLYAIQKNDTFREGIVMAHQSTVYQNYRRLPTVRINETEMLQKAGDCYLDELV